MPLLQKHVKAKVMISKAQMTLPLTNCTFFESVGFRTGPGHCVAVVRGTALLGAYVTVVGITYGKEGHSGTYSLSTHTHLHC